MKKFKVQELVSTGVYATVYFLIVAIATLISHLTIPVYNNLFLPSVSALLSGTLYIMVLNKIPKMGAITVMGMTMGIFFIVTSYFPLAFIPSFIMPLAADYMLSKSSSPSKIQLYVSYIVFSFGLTGPILPMWFMKKSYVDSLLSEGKDMVYVNQIFEAISMGSFYMSMITLVISSIVGLRVGEHIYQKHFLRGEKS